MRLLRSLGALRGEPRLITATLPSSQKSPIFIQNTSMGSTLFVSGASGNLGSAVAAYFSSHGYTVYGTVSKTSEAPSFKELVLDATDEAQCNTTIAATIQESTQINAAVLTIGGFAMGSLEETDYASIEKQITLNFKTAYLLAKPLFLHFLEKGIGTLFLISSGAGTDPSAATAVVAYGLSKALIVDLAELLNALAAKKKSAARVVVVVPGTIDTPQNRAAMPNADTGKWISPQNLAKAIFEEHSQNLKSEQKNTLKLGF